MNSERDNEWTVIKIFRCVRVVDIDNENPTLFMDDVINICQNIVFAEPSFAKVPRPPMCCPLSIMYWFLLAHSLTGKKTGDTLFFL